MDPFSVALSAVMLTLSPFASINTPLALKVTDWPGAFTVPNVRSPVAVTETAPLIGAGDNTRAVDSDGTPLATDQIGRDSQIKLYKASLGT